MDSDSDTNTDSGANSDADSDSVSDSPAPPEIDFALYEGRDSASSFAKGSEPRHAFLKSKSGWKANDTHLPAFIWREFAYQMVRPSRISFLPRKAQEFGLVADRMPSKFQFIGSKDPFCSTESNWETICQDESGNRITEMTEARGCEVRQEHRQYFNCVGLKILQIGGRVSDNRPALRGIRMWGEF